MHHYLELLMFSLAASDHSGLDLKTAAQKTLQQQYKQLHEQLQHSDIHDFESLDQLALRIQELKFSFPILTHIYDVKNLQKYSKALNDAQLAAQEYQVLASSAAYIQQTELEASDWFILGWLTAKQEVYAQRILEATEQFMVSRKFLISILNIFKTHAKNTAIQRQPCEYSFGCFKLKTEYKLFSFQAFVHSSLLVHLWIYTIVKRTYLFSSREFPMSEIELKFQIPHNYRAAFEIAFKKNKLVQQQRLWAKYYDSPDQHLAQQRIALRQRLEGDIWRQTLKAPSPQHYERFELEHELGHDAPELCDLACYENHKQARKILKKGFRWFRSQFNSAV